MNFRFCDQRSVMTQQNLHVPPGRYEAFYLKINGVHTSSYARTSVGTIIGYLNGQVLWSFDFGHMVDITNMLFGWPEDTAGTTFLYACLIPMWMPGSGRGVPGIGNAIYVAPEDTCFFTVPAQAVATSATGTLYACPAFSPTKFITKISMHTRTLAGGVERFETGQDNTYAIFAFEAVTTNPTNVRVRVDDLERFSALWGHGVAFSNIISEVEAAVTPMKIDLNPTRAIEEMVSSNCEIEITGGTGAQDYVIFSAEFESERRARSLVAIAEDAVKAKRIVEAQQREVRTFRGTPGSAMRMRGVS